MHKAAGAFKTKTVLLALAGLICGHLPASAEPSFNCDGKLSPAESLICKDFDLGSKDRYLASIYRKVLAGAGAQRAAIQADETAWIKKREQCLVGKTGKTETDAVDCLSTRFDERIAALRALRPGMDESRALCQTILNRYTAILTRDPEREHSLTETLRSDPASGFEYSSEEADLRSDDEPQWPDALSYIGEKFRVDPALRRSIKPDDGNGPLDGVRMAWVMRLPQTNVYGIFTRSGSMGCMGTPIFYQTAQGNASLAETPDTGPEIEGDCSVIAPRLGRLDQTPLYVQPRVQDEKSATEESYDFIAWKNGWQPACSISLTYAPKPVTGSEGNKVQFGPLRKATISVP